MRYLLYSLMIVLVAGLGLLGWAWQTVTWYEPVIDVPVICREESNQEHSAWSADKPLKVLSYNVQYMASKNYLFFYEGGDDRQPSKADTVWTLDQVARIIREENPDIVMLQEVDDELDGRSHHVDQVAELQRRLGASAFACQADAHYWQAGFIVDPRIWSDVSMKLTTLSRYPLHSARRHQLPLMEKDPLTQRFYFQRALLETHITSREGHRVALINTHFDAWGAGSDIMAKQVAATQALLDDLTSHGTAWILGGDFNLLPPDGGLQYQRLQDQRLSQGYDEQSALAPMYRRYGAIPALEKLTASDPAEVAKWYTHFPNGPEYTAPDRTIDYVFYSADWQLQQAYIRQHDTWNVSDHLPVVGSFTLQGLRYKARLRIKVGEPCCAQH